MSSSLFQVDEAVDAEQSENVRPGSIRPEGLKGAGLRFADASLASTTGPVFNADDLPEGEVLRPGMAIKGLYAAFNARDSVCVASFLTDDCVYEDLLLGPATVCRGKQAFMSALRFHPAFVSSRIFSGLPFADLLPDLTLEVDSIAEGVDTVGVEWHVQCGESAFPLGRGLSQATVCPSTGKIKRVVDIAEAPWRVVGVMALPIISLVQTVSKAIASQATSRASELQGLDGSSSGDGGAKAPQLRLRQEGDEDGSSDVSKESAASRQYELMLAACLADGIVHPNERAMLADFAVENAVADEEHVELLERAGWSEADFALGYREGD